MKLRCDKIIVTGGGSGIGAAIARRLIDAGASVVAAGRTAEKLQSTAEAIASERLHILEWDIADVNGIPKKLNEAAALMGGLNGLVNAAALGTGVLTGRGYEPWDITEDEWDALMDVNCKGTFFMMRDMIDYLLARHEKGNILNIASNDACMDVIGSYGISKLGLIRLTRALGKKYGSEGIIINGIAPGATFTPMIARYAKHIDDPYPRHAIGRFIRPDEIAELAYYLMSDYGEIICGHTVVADGGDRAATL